MEHGAEWSDYCIADKPEVEAGEAVVHTGVGHQAVLVCHVHASPAAEVAWYRGTLLLEQDNRMYRETVGTRHSLVLHHVREEEFTQYRCQVTYWAVLDFAVLYRPRPATASAPAPPR